MNGSNTILLPKDGRHRSNAKVSVLQLLESGICLVESTLRPRPAVILTHRSRSDRGDDNAEQSVHMLAATGSIQLGLATEFILRPNTPLFNNFLDCMSGNAAGIEIMDFLTIHCFYNDILSIDE